MDSIAKTYDPTIIEPKWYQFWNGNNLFYAKPDKDKKPYCIMMPPPNVTGILHMGHALQSTIQDTLIRFHRMRGYSALWMPGTDHAGIATQNVVEKKLRQDGTSRQEVGREKFIEQVWEWKHKHGNIITGQQKKLGSSCDWSRERFTMDEGLSRAVRETFVKLFDKGLVYKGKYIVNWCPHHQTALSDEEVKHKEKQGSLWYINYHVKDGDGHVTVATTRPETMLGDTAVAVNPEDERYSGLIGKTVILPVQEKEIPVIADEYVDREFGTGVVKVTPAHDPNDFEMGNRHELPRVVVINESGKMTAEAGKMFEGQDRFDCRKKLVEELENRGVLDKVEEYQNSVGHCHRCSTVIEPMVSDQWFIRMKPLAEAASRVVRDGEVVFHPAKWEKDYFYWMDNIRDWCISRQLWWGHRIPVWYCSDCGEIMASVEDLTQCTKCSSTNIKQDEDVLDTWASSWLWPFSTLDWPEETEEFKFYYPTSVLVSGYDILFFWIARMVMAGLEFTGKIPFKDVYITGMIKDEQGRIMSKSLGNGIDPIEMIDLYGADAVRYSLVVLNTEGQDIKLAKSKFEMGRNFANKIWNAYRFLKMKEEEISGNSEISAKATEPDLSDRWIISRLNATIRDFYDNFNRYRMSDSATTIYKFLWNDFCDWYVEIIKNRLFDGEAGAAHTFNTIAMPTFKKTMELLHPLMPFITEEIWQNVQPDGTLSIMNADPGEYESSKIDPDADRDMGLLQDVIYAVRNIRGEMNVPPSTKIKVHIKCSSQDTVELLKRYSHYIYNLAKVEKAVIGLEVQKPPQSATAVMQGMGIYIPLSGIINIDDEKTRLKKEIDRHEKQIKAVGGKLSNENFVSRAPEEVVAHEREKLKTYETNFKRLKSNLESLEE